MTSNEWFTKNTKAPLLIHPFSSDRPITKNSEDLLDRRNFSEKLAKAISGWKEKDSLVLAVYGQWGDGKSSVKNMVVDYLQSDMQSTCKPSVLEFNPWHWHDSSKLIHAFFDQLSLHLGKEDASEKSKKAAEKWKIYSEHLQLASTTVGDVVKPYCGVIGRALVSGLQCLIKLFFKSNTLQKPLFEIKKELSDDLISLDGPIIVVIDDIDRLRKAEIQTLFQLIKNNADFPNFIFLLFFQRDIIEKHLTENDIYNGSEYLEKIVQVAFDLPQLNLNNVHELLQSKIEKILHQNDLSEKFDTDRWRNIFSQGLSPYFKNLRDVKRFLSKLSFYLELMKEDETFHVNLVDLISLEVLRQFEPKVYNSIYSNKIIFTANPYRKSGGYSSQDNPNKKIIQEIVKNATDGKEDPVKAIITHLFPNVNWCFEGFNQDVTRNDLINLRVNHAEVFDRYFQLHLPSGNLSKGEIKKLISLRNREEFRIYFEDLHRRKLLSSFLSEFETYNQKLNTSHTEPFITAIFDIGDLLSDGIAGMISTPETIRACHIIDWFLHKEDKKTRKSLILNAIKETKGLYLPTKFIRSKFDNPQIGSYSDTFQFDNNELNELKKAGLELIKGAVESGSLFQSNYLFQILFFWEEWDGNKPPREWVEELIKSEEGLIKFFVAFTFTRNSYINTNSGFSVKTDQYVDFKSVDHFFKIETVKDRLEKIDLTKLNDDQKKSIKAGLDAIEQKLHPETQRGRSQNT